MTAPRKIALRKYGGRVSRALRHRKFSFSPSAFGLPLCFHQPAILPGTAGTDEYLKMEATLSAFENFLQTADAKRLTSPMLMEFLIPIFHIFSGLVKKLLSSSV
ncbi:hypothetical protein TNCV_1930041 [Trichonephila clavipes]|nr:hypothetical protein TNCV_1930041 [Trichonephila clavipes]